MPRYQTRIGPRSFSFPDLKSVLACATPRRSGDELAGIAAESDEQRVAARYVLSELPLSVFLSEQVVPYELDEVTRLIVDTHNKTRVTSVIISHDIEGTFQIADFVAMLHEGKIIEQGDSKSFQKSPHPFVRRFLERRGD